MAGILEKRYSLHRHLEDEKRRVRTLESQIEPVQALANIGMLWAMAAHEINNILTPLGSYAQLALANPDDRELTIKALQKTILNSQRAGCILESILSLADGRARERKFCSVRRLVEEVFACIGRDFAKDRIEVNINIPEEISIWGESVCLEQVFMNLILNARQAMLGKGGRLSISADRSGDMTRIRVADTGCGIEPENLRNIFEPFFTTKTRTGDNSTGGSGLGLTFCKRIIDAHKGFISVESEQGRGTVFTVILPDNQP